MANNIYVIDESPGKSRTQTDDGSGKDWLIFQGSYALPTSIRLDGYVENGVSSQARGFFYHIGNWGTSLVVHGAIENASGSSGEDWISGNELDNILYGDPSRDGAGDDDTLFGATGDDTIYGGAGRDDMGGADGNDLLDGGAGIDTLSGGGGSDTLIGGAGADSISGGADGTDWVFYTGSSAAVDVRLISGDTSTSFGGDAEGDRITGVNNVRGSDFNDKITDLPESNAFNANRFDGRDGHDLLKMGGGNDTAYGGSGNDTIRGEDGNDRLYGDVGRDVISGGAGRDRIFGGEGVNQLDGGAGNDTVTGGAQRDILYGGDGNDVLDGGEGNDLFFGNDGRDTLRGDAGDDVLIGSEGADRLFGGAGADEFKYIARGESAAGAPHDVIADFSRAEGDKLNFDQVIATGTFIGTAAFSGQAGEARFITTATGSRAFIDLDGDTRADFAVDVLGLSVLRASDFIL